jgi:hypothetical protein
MINEGGEPGSTQVCGQAEPNLPGGTCGLVVCGVGDNGIPEPDPGNPTDPCGGDDENLNQAGPVGSDGLGNFCVDLNRPLENGDAIYVVDTCTPSVGDVILITAPAPAPALSKVFTTVGLMILAWIAFVGIGRLRRTP